jgi:hypothetical protein
VADLTEGEEKTYDYIISISYEQKIGEYIPAHPPKYHLTEVFLFYFLQDE